LIDIDAEAELYWHDTDLLQLPSQFFAVAAAAAAVAVASTAQLKPVPD